MTTVGIGDMSQAFLNSRNINSVKARLNTLNSELNTGRISDIALSLRGQTSVIDGLDRDIKLLQEFETSNSMLASSLERLQLTFGSIDDMRNSMVEQFLPLTADSLDTEFELAAKRARSDMATIVSKINQRDAGQAMLSGVSVDVVPLAAAEDMLGDIVTLVGPATDAATIISTVTNWFETPGAGFDTLGYVGDTGGPLRKRISQNETLSLQARADDPAVRSVLKGVALAAISDALPSAIDNDVRAELMRASAEELLSASADLVALRAGIGENEERISLAQTTQAAQNSAFSIARNDMTLADPYETATRLQDVQRQLELQFTSTARLSQLSLVNYL